LFRARTVVAVVSSFVFMLERALHFVTGGNGVLADKTLPLAAAFRARKLEGASAAG